MASKLDKILKLLEGLDDESVDKVKEALPTEEEPEQEEVEEQETQEETKEETQEPKYVTPEQLEKAMKALLENVSTKGDLEEVKKEVDTSRKKAKPFGAESKVDNTKKEDNMPSVEDILRKVNSNFR